MNIPTKIFEEVLLLLDTQEKELILAIILSKGNKSNAAENVSMSRNKFSVLFDHACDKIKKRIMQDASDTN